MDEQLLERMWDNARGRLLAMRSEAGHWEGRLSSSALSTATATTALALYAREEQDPAAKARDEELVRRGMSWLAATQNEDGGWGDTDRSFSNISTTTLVWAAANVAGVDWRSSGRMQRLEQWLTAHAGGLTADKLAPAIEARYGRDRTFSVPILTMCALAGRFAGEGIWRRMPRLPFELAAVPHRLYAAVRMPVVSYALPALIAIGLVQHAKAPAWNPLALLVRRATRGRVLRILQDIQPASGGFLEATPLTSFVSMSLIGAGLRSQPVVEKGVGFLRHSAREDGSWAIDTNLATWLTTLTVEALGEGGNDAVLAWLLGQQYKAEHPYTHAAPGGWAWTDLPGGVPDADDTSGALLALAALGGERAQTTEAARHGVTWLLGLQNADGGVPTFCRGWGRLPFDRSSQDITAHALRAVLAWWRELPNEMDAQITAFASRALAYLDQQQRDDGAWVALWFGNQHATGEVNATYGTSRVLRALEACLRMLGRDAGVSRMYRRGVEWLLAAQRGDGGWGGGTEALGPASIEETALAVDALASGLLKHAATTGPCVEEAIERGVRWLAEHTNEGRAFVPSPIGFYFASLWYYEDTYPVIFTVGALRRVRDLRGP